MNVKIEWVSNHKNISETKISYRFSTQRMTYWHRTNPSSNATQTFFPYILKTFIDITWHEIKFGVFVRWKEFHTLLRSATDVEENRICECLKFASV
jgi:hypothetical protein